MTIGPKTRQGKGFAIIFGIFLTIMNIWYFVTRFDLIPDVHAIGYFDDVVVLILSVAVSYAFYKRFVAKGSRFRTGTKNWFKKHSLVDILTSKDTWLLAIMTFLTVTYWKWIWDIVPDPTAIVGRLDDLTLILYNLKLLIDWFMRRGR